ncbi:MAG: hypothetical protein AAF631_09500, partial [Pseudomonadota bacterium]
IWVGRANAILVASAGLISEKDANTVERIAELTAIVGTERKPPFKYRLTNPIAVVACPKAVAVSHPSAQLTLAVEGLGVTGCLDLCAAEFIRAGVLRHVLADRFSIPLEIRLMTPHRRNMRTDPALKAAMTSIDAIPLPPC